VLVTYVLPISQYNKICILTVSDHVHLEYERISASTRDVHDHEQLVYKSSVNMYSVVMYVAT